MICEFIPQRIEKNNAAKYREDMRKKALEFIYDSPLYYFDLIQKLWPVGISLFDKSRNICFPLRLNAVIKIQIKPPVPHMPIFRRPLSQLAARRRPSAISAILRHKSLRVCPEKIKMGPRRKAPLCTEIKLRKILFPFLRFAGIEADNIVTANRFVVFPRRIDFITFCLRRQGKDA